VKAPILTPWRTVDRGPDAPDCEALHADEPTARAYLDALPAGRVAVSARAWPCRQRGAWLVPVEQGWANVPVGRLLRPARVPA
jgi:hypothetical protein